MRIAIIADIHGNQTALEAVLHDLDGQPGIDQIVIAGDLCLNGPRPREVLRTVEALRCPVIQGNVDTEVVTATLKKKKQTSKKHSIVAWTREQIGQEGIEYLASLLSSYRVNNPGGSDALIVHANPQNQEDAIFPTASDSQLDELLGGLEPAIGAVAFGHLHIAYTRRWRHLLLCDVGSCGLPRDEDLRASYGILTWQEDAWQAEIRRVEYDVQEVVKQLETCGMPHAEKRIKVLMEARY
jgi:predicted phosphodiesterase